MHFTPLKVLLTGVLILSGYGLTGCSNGTGTPDPSADSTAPFSACTLPRPEICTQQYVPVCATRSDGSQQTYPNRCTACADVAVTGTRADPCD